MSILSIGELLDLGNSAATAGLVPYSALEYNETGAISGISGSAIAGGVDTTIVSAIASSYVDSGVSSKVDQSAFDDCCSAMSAVVSAKLDASASSQFQPSGNYQPSGDYYSATNPSGFITTADITGKLDTTASSLFQPSGDYADASSLSSKLDASASGMFAPSGNYQSAGDYAFNSSLSSKLDASASSDFYLASNPSGFITGVDLDGYATTGYVESSVSGKLDSTASGQFQPSGEYYSASNPSGFITGVDLSNYATTEYVDSSISGKLDHSAVETDEDGYVTGIDGSAINGGGAGVDSATVSAIASSYAESATSGLSGQFWPLSSADLIRANTPGFTLSGTSAGNYITVDTSEGITYSRSSNTYQTNRVASVEPTGLYFRSERYSATNKLISSIETEFTERGIKIDGYATLTSDFAGTSKTSLSHSYELDLQHISGEYNYSRSSNGTVIDNSSLQYYLDGNAISGSSRNFSNSSYWKLSPNCVSGSASGNQDISWKLDTSSVSGKNWSLNSAKVEGSAWQLGKTEYDYWNAKMDSVPTSILLAGSGLIISSQDGHYSIEIDVPTLKTMLGI